jgi:hypothetical protein
MASEQKRELIEPHEGDKRYVRRGERGEFSESDDVTRSLRGDVRQPAEHDAKPGHGDEGDHARA